MATDVRNAPARITFPVSSFRHLETPFMKKGFRDYFAVVEVGDLPDLSEWRRINVRDPKLSGSVPQHIRASLHDNPELFVFMNRGIVLSVDGAEFDAKSSTVTVSLRDPRLHGLLDGGHTYNIILEEREGLSDKQYVRVEMLEGFRTEDVPHVVDARNTSNQVRDQSLMNLSGHFQPLKAALAGTAFENLVAYKEYELLDDDTPKPIDVREVISILTCFEREHFNRETHPIISYSSKAQCLQHFKKYTDSYRRIYPLAPSLLKLYDQIYASLPELYNKARGKRDGLTTGRFGNLTGVSTYSGRRRQPLRFMGSESSYGIPDGFIYPILGAFRSLLEEAGDHYSWAKGADPFKLLEGELGETLAYTVGTFALDNKNPSKTGKSALVWQSCYQAAENIYLRTAARA